MAVRFENLSRQKIECAIKIVKYWLKSTEIGAMAFLAIKDSFILLPIVTGLVVQWIVFQIPILTM